MRGTKAPLVGSSSSAGSGELVTTGNSVAMANSAARGPRPGSLRRPLRFPGSGLVITDNFGLSEGLPVISLTAIEPAASTLPIKELLVSVSGRSSPAAKRKAFLRAVRLAPPRERRFFFFSESSPSAAKSKSALAGVKAELSDWEFRLALTESTGGMLISTSGCSSAKAAAWNCSFSVATPRWLLPRPSRRFRSGRPDRAPR